MYRFLRRDCLKPVITASPILAPGFLMGVPQLLHGGIMRLEPELGREG